MYNRYRTIWISDIHLGTRGCQAEMLLDFLRSNESDTLYLVGDIIDGWALKKSWYWPQAHNDVVQKLLRRARKGTRVYYISGNHDEAVRDYLGLRFGEVRVCDEVIHTTADRRRFLVVHGDRYDGVIQHSRWLAKLGATAYHLALDLNTVFNWCRCRMGWGYWSLSAYLKHKVKNAVNFISKYEETLAREARERGLGGVVCGHIHKAEMRDIEGILYCNDGDWVESCTALVEDYAGELKIVQWAREGRATRSTPSAVVVGE